METTEQAVAICPEGLEREIARMKGYFPFRIAWGYVDAEGKNHVQASYDKRQMNKAIRAGFTVFSTK